MKKLLSFLMMGVMVLALAACGSNKSEEAAKAPTEAPAAKTETEKPAEQAKETEKSAETDNKVDFPTKAMNIIVPFSAGGGTDITARAIADSAKNHFPQPLVVVNQTGAGGAVGMGAGANAAPDGYNITCITVELVTLPPQKLATFTSDNFKPILQFNAEPSALTVKADAPWNTVEEFIKYALEHPGELQLGNSGVGAIWHLAAKQLEKETGTEFTHIPYEGAQPAVTALLGGHIDAVTVSPAEVATHVASGDLKILGIMSQERSASFPDVPTFVESGYDVAIGTWRGLGVPKDTPQEVVDILEEGFLKAAEEEAFKEIMANQNATIEVLNSEEFKSKLDAEKVQFEELISTLQ